MTAFLLYAGSRRAKIQEQNPGIKVTDISKELGKEWRGLSKKAKGPFAKEATKLKKKYDKEKAKYDKEKAKHAPPKRPMGAFFLFCSDAREQVKKENPDAKITEIAKLLGAAWRALEDEKAEYTKKATELRGKWKVKFDTWKAKQPITA